MRSRLASHAHKGRGFPAIDNYLCMKFIIINFMYTYTSLLFINATDPRKRLDYRGDRTSDRSQIAISTRHALPASTHRLATENNSLGERSSSTEVGKTVLSIVTNPSLVQVDLSLRPGSRRVAFEC